MITALNFHFPENEEHGVIINLVDPLEPDANGVLHLTFDDDFLEDFMENYRQHRIDIAIKE